MRYLVDANVLSEATKQEPIAGVLDWLFQNESEIVVNPIILGELEYGVLRLPDGRRREGLLRWLLAGKQKLPTVTMDAATATEWATLLVKLAKVGRAMPIKDSLIAASALQHDLTLVTRNIRGFEPAGVRLVNPFSG